MRKLFITCAMVLGILAMVAPPSSAQITWKQVDGPKGGAIRDVAVDSSGGLWLATGRAGAYYSADNGESWVAINAGLPSHYDSLVIGLITIAAAPDGYIYAVNINNERFLRLNSALPRSQWHWEEVFPDQFQGPYNYIMTLPNNSVFTNTGGYGILRSIDHGTTWTQFADTLKDSNCISLAHGKGLFAVLTGRQSKPLQAVPIWINKATDGGISWIKRANFPDFFPSQILIAHNGNFVVSTRSKDEILGSDTTIHGGRIYVSHDSCMTWQMVYERPYNSEDGKNGIDDIGFVQLTGTIYANAHGITVRSTDNGETWTTLDSEKRGDEQFKVASNKDESHVYQICEPDGVFRSDDHGATYLDKYEGLNVQFLNGMVISSKQELFTISEYGLSKSSDNGQTWGAAVEFGETYFPSLFISKNPSTLDHIFIGCEFGFFRSTDDGATLQQFLTSSAKDVYRQIGETSSGKIFTFSSLVGGNTAWLMYTQDEGTTWDTITTLPDKTDPIKQFAITHDSILVAGTGPTFYLSLDAGKTWKTQTTSAPLSQPQQMFFGADGAVYARVPGNSNIAGAWRSTDAGATWIHIFPWADASNDQLVRQDYFSMNLDRDGRVLLGTDSGVFRSDNKTFIVWQNVSMGLNWQNWDTTRYVNVSDIVVNPITGKYYAASRGLSVFEGTDVPSDVSFDRTVTASGSEIVNYPNPFTTSTTIAFKLEKASPVTINVYDAMGRRVGQMLTATLGSGDQRLSFDGSMLPSGTYLVDLRANGITRTTWMTVTK